MHSALVQFLSIQARLKDLISLTTGTSEYAMQEESEKSFHWASFQVWTRVSPNTTLVSEVPIQWMEDYNFTHANRKDICIYFFYMYISFLYVCIFSMYIT